MGIIRDSFVIFNNWAEAINTLPEEYQLECYKALVVYGTTGQIPAEISSVAKAMLVSFSVGMDKSILRYEASVKNGQSGGRPRKKENLEKPSETQNNQDKPTQNLNDDVDVNVHVNNAINKPKIVDVDILSESSSTQSEFFNLFPSDFYDCEIPPKINLELLVSKIRESSYIQRFRKLSEMLNKYDEIITDKYKDFEVPKKNSNKEPLKRKYTKTELNSLFDDIYKVEI